MPSAAGSQSLNRKFNVGLTLTRSPRQPVGPPRRSRKMVWTSRDAILPDLTATSPTTAWDPQCATQMLQGDDPAVPASPSRRHWRKGTCHGMVDAGCVAQRQNRRRGTLCTDSVRPAPTGSLISVLRSRADIVSDEARDGHNAGCVALRNSSDPRSPNRLHNGWMAVPPIAWRSAIAARESLDPPRG